MNVHVYVGTSHSDSPFLVIPLISDLRSDFAILQTAFRYTSVKGRQR